MNRNQIRGMLVGGAIGDAWGMAVEGWSPERIRETHPEGMTGYREPIGHKWFKQGETLPGTTTDDTQLTLAVMLALNRAGAFNMDQIAQAHVESLQECSAGFGRSTTEAVRRLQNNVKWWESGKTTEKNRGLGNGVPMKVAPLAAMAVAIGDEWRFQWLADFAGMTHYTKTAVYSAANHFAALHYCLTTEDFCRDVWLMMATANFESRHDWNIENFEDPPNNYREAMEKLWQNRYVLDSWDQDKLREEFGNGSYNVADSLPFSYAFYYQNPDSLQTLQRLIEAGGDTDSNAKFVGEMMGAVHGLEFFQTPENRWAIDGLRNYDYLIAMANQFCNRFSIFE